jgi:hypothetical protein
LASPFIIPLLKPETAPESAAAPIKEYGETKKPT